MGDSVIEWSVASETQNQIFTNLENLLRHAPFQLYAAKSNLGS